MNLDGFVCVAEDLKLHGGNMLDFHQQALLFQLVATKINLLEAF